MNVEFEKDGSVATVILNRPNARNAVDPETAGQLVAAFKNFDGDDELKVAVFYGAHGTFCAGWDLKYGASLQGGPVLEELNFPADDSETPRGPMGPTRLFLSKPIIAAVAGAAVAGGMELALWCDVRVMEEDAYFGVYCRRWGIPLMDGGTLRLPRLVGQGRAMEILLTGRKVPSEEALRIGLCEKVTPKGKSREAAEDMARDIARFPQGAMLADRRSAYEQFGLSARAAMEQEWANGLDALKQEGVAGAGRFAAGIGRHGDFSEI